MNMNHIHQLWGLESNNISNKDEGLNEPQQDRQIERPQRGKAS
jgi:hypothetical protein